MDAAVGTGWARLAPIQQQGLLEGVQVTVTSRVQRTPDFEPGVAEYWGTITSTLWADDEPGPGGDDPVRAAWDGLPGAQPVDDDDQVTVALGHIRVLLADLTYGVDQVWDACDALDADVEALGESLLRHRDHLNRLATGGGSGVVLLDRVEVDPAWRGRGIGAVAAGLLLQHWSFGAVAALALPMAPDAVGAQRDAARTGLTRYWSRLGFAPVTDDDDVLWLPLAPGWVSPMEPDADR